MPRQVGVAVENNFIRGLITEATGLKFPENAATETYNCVFDYKGVVSRRLGFDYEEDFVVQSSGDFTGKAIATYVWKNVAEEGDLTFVVRQVGDTLKFYRVSSDASLSSGLHSHTIDLTTLIPTSSTLTTVQTYECQFASGNGTLFVTNPKLDTFYVTYDVGTDTFTLQGYFLYTRDFEGDEADTLEVNNRPTSTLAALSAAHRYNLKNQGWTTTTLTEWDTARTDMPSNADVSWYYKSLEIDASGTNDVHRDVYDFSVNGPVDNFTLGNSPAPKGHFIYSVYDVNRSAQESGATSFEIEAERVSTCAFFAGRVWYGGLKYQGFNSKIFFSQIIEKPTQYGWCYQANDPTAELQSDLLASDGGFVDLIEAGNVLKMVPYLNTLIVFCTNGVWAITGSSGSGFAANDYAVTKLSAISNVSHTSFVSAEDKIFWWSHTGIYTISKDPQTNALAVQSVTENTIQEFFEAIPLDSRENARGVYDSLNKRVQWIYRSQTAGTFTERYEYDRVLNLNMVSGAFYPWSVDTTSKRIMSIVSVTGAGGSQISNQVVVGVDDVVVGADNVVVFTSPNSSIDAVTKFFVRNDSNTIPNATWAEEFRDTYLDWTDTSYESYFLTGYKLRGEGMRKHQTNYLRLYSDNENPSTFSVRAVWDYALDGARGRISESQQVGQIITMSDPTSYAIKTRRIKIRGHGLVCQLLFNSVEGEPFDIIGWTSLDSVNQRP